MSKRAVIYARVSTVSQGDNYSIRTQIEECKRYAENKGYSIVGDHYVDLESGKMASHSDEAELAYIDTFSSLELSRPGLDAAYDYLDLIGFDVVIVYSIDRLDRDPYKLKVHEYGFKKNGADVEYVTGNYTDSPEGKFMKNVIASAAQLENDWRTERCNRGKRKKARMGLYVAGRPPFGYDYSDDPMMPGGLSIVEDQAEIVRQIFTLYVSNGHSIRGIARELESPKSSISRILANPAYTGKLYYNKTKRDGNLLIDRDKEEWIEIPITPIIDEELFNAANRKLRLNKKTKRKKTKREYLLSGMVICADCGKAYYCETARAGKQRRNNDAPNYRHRISHGHCVNKMYSARIIDSKVWNKIKQLLLEPETLKEGYKQLIEQEQANHKRQLEYIEEYQRTKNKLIEKRNILFETYIDPDFDLSKVDYLKERKKIDSEISKLDKQIDHVDQQISSLPSPTVFENLESFSYEIQERLTDNNWKPTLQNKRKVLQMLHVKVILDRNGHGKIEGWFDEIDGLSSQTF